MAQCSECKLKFADHPDPESIATGICRKCRDLLGVVPMPPPRRRAAPCTRCNGMQFVRVMSGEQTVPVGALEMYICAGCGFIEWYCQEPSAIPIGPKHMCDVVDYRPDSAYR